MPLSGDYIPSSTDWVADQVAEYESSGGRRGNLMKGKPVVIVWTRGRTSGAVRKTPLMRVENDGVFAAIASKGGADDHPEWYLNIEADPTEVGVQDGPTVSDRHARVVTGVEREAWWARAVEAFPDYAAYAEKTDREIPVVLLEQPG